jgi:hypothetical protein
VELRGNLIAVQSARQYIEEELLVSVEQSTSDSVPDSANANGNGNGNGRKSSRKPRGNASSRAEGNGSPSSGGADEIVISMFSAELFALLQANDDCSPLTDIAHRLSEKYKMKRNALKIELSSPGSQSPYIMIKGTPIAIHEKRQIKHDFFQLISERFSNHVKLLPVDPEFLVEGLTASVIEKGELVNPQTSITPVVDLSLVLVVSAPLLSSAVLSTATSRAGAGAGAGESRAAEEKASAARCEAVTSYIKALERNWLSCIEVLHIPEYLIPSFVGTSTDIYSPIYTYTYTHTV